MGLFWRATGLLLVALVLGLTLEREGKQFAILLTAAACCMVAGAAVEYLEPVVAFLRQLEDLGQLPQQMLGILLKVVGIGLTAQIAAMVCSDAGNAALGKQLQLLSTAAILYLSLPLFSGLLGLIREILGEL